MASTMTADVGLSFAKPSLRCGVGVGCKERVSDVLPLKSTGTGDDGLDLGGMQKAEGNDVSCAMHKFSVWGLGRRPTTAIARNTPGR